MKLSSNCFFWATALVSFPSVAHAQTQTYFTGDVNERAVACPEEPSQIGYKHVTDVNVDQQTELDRIARGEAPRTPYIFPFCKSFKYLMDQEVLQVLLDDIKFVCGFNGENDELCIFEGNHVQVDIAPGASNKNVHFEGISFFGFTGTSIKAHGDGTSKLTIKDAAFQNFYGGAVAIDQQNPQGGVPMQVEVLGSTFRNGTGSNLFDNVGGSLVFDDMKIIDNIRVDSMIRTSNRGTSTLAKVDATMGDLTRLTHTLGGGRQTITGVKVYEMFSIGSLFFVEGAGSNLQITGAEVLENRLLEQIKNQMSSNFNVLIATDQATADIKDVKVIENEGLDRVFSANDKARVTVTDALVSNNVGTQPPDLLSNIAMAEDGGSMNVLRATVEDINAFSAAWFAICGSVIVVKQSCLLGTSKLAAPAFVSSDSTFISEGNYMEYDDLEVARCFDNAALPVFSEINDDSQCFSTTGTGVCDGTCISGFADQTGCLANDGDRGYTLAAQPAPAAGGQGNPSCPASPPTPMPTLPPQAFAGAGAAGSEDGNQPAFTATIPPGQGLGGNSNNGGEPGSGNSGEGGTIFESNGGNNSGAGARLPQWSQLLQFGSALLVAKLMHRMML